jgi:hypothetical protein
MTKLQRDEAFRAIHTYLSLARKCCADGWRMADMQTAKDMLDQMGIPWEGDGDDLKGEFVRLRKAGKLPGLLDVGRKEVPA